MKKTFSYTSLNRLGFYLSYFFHKCILPFEMRRNHLAFWLYELRYTLEKFRRYDSSLPYTGTSDIISTKFGDYRVRLNTSDAANVSPAFERADINRLNRLIKSLLAQGKRVLFLDVGGDIGSYSVMVANRFPSDRLSIACFEPVAESRAFIEENLRLNDAHGRVVVYPYALFTEDDQKTTIKLVVGAPGSSSMTENVDAEVREVEVTTKRLDTLIGNDVADYDAVIFKIDVEGVEQDVLEGATGIIASGKEMYAMVEDFIKPSIIGYLQKTGWAFDKKVTDYNSWWKKA